VRNDSDYSADHFKQSTVNIEEIIVLRSKELNEQVVLQHNNRIKNYLEEDEISENDLEDDTNLENNTLQPDKSSNNNGYRMPQGIKRQFSKKF
jgi:hypothetical protein